MTDPTNLPDNVLERLERAEQLKLAGKHLDAIALLEELVLEDPSIVPALEEIADNELSLERFDRAESAAQQAVEMDSGSYTGHYILGYVRSHQMRWEEALVHLKQANKLRPNNPEILRCLGWALLRLQQRPQGVVTLERSLNLDTDNTLTLCDLGVAYLELRNIPKAKALFQRVLDLDPMNDRAKECILAINRIERDMKDAKRSVKQMS